MGALTDLFGSTFQGLGRASGFVPTSKENLLSKELGNNNSDPFSFSASKLSLDEISKKTSELNDLKSERNMRAIGTGFKLGSSIAGAVQESKLGKLREALQQEEFHQSERLKQEAFDRGLTVEEYMAERDMDLSSNSRIAEILKRFQKMSQRKRSSKNKSASQIKLEGFGGI